jgi:hypothetical protein
MGLPARLLAPALSEREWQWQVVRLARLRGWATYHTFDSRRSDPGYPDLTLCRGSRLVFAELKTDRGRLRPEQVAWLSRLRAAGAEVHVWKPRDWDTVMEVLA